MTEKEWLSCGNASTLLKYLGSRITIRKMRLLACACCRRIGNSLSPAADAALSVAEGYADQKATKDELPTFKKRVRQLGRVDRAVANACNKHASVKSLEWAMKEAHRAVILDTEEHSRLDKYYAEYAAQVVLLCDIFGNPFRPVSFDPTWRTTTALALAQGIYDDRAFDGLPILADALQDAGCDNDDLLNHLRDPNATHVRGCWALDLVLGKD